MNWRHGTIGDPMEIYISTQKVQLRQTMIITDLTGILSEIYVRQVGYFL